MAPTDKDGEGSRAGGSWFNYNVGCAIGVIVLGVAIWLLTPYQVEEAATLFGQPASGLDAHLFPRMVGAVFVGLGIWYLLIAPRLKDPNLLRRLDREAITNTCVSLAVFLLFAFVMEHLGFVISAALVMFFLSTFYGNRNYWLGALVSILVPLAVFNLFTKVLLVFLPAFPNADLYWL